MRQDPGAGLPKINKEVRLEEVETRMGIPKSSGLKRWKPGWVSLHASSVSQEIGVLVVRDCTSVLLG
ncbi:hypothetical protein JTE90_022110 [Oedothorax gibbosus]|uniref:Uncharacterized protein n=1 Tax=Oedothorax gibbosus TaxID=931172 RepID=A0AAV6VUA4_9ARAC|nr:hypothetical protein JTE90_022110 [Oedothorax gibbosus]